MTEEKVNILVVDDLPEKRLVFQVVLEELGQNIVMASSGAEALRALLERDFAVILLDVNMPDIDGIETAELIRQHKKTAHIPIIFVTAYADEMQTARGYRLGAVDYILSPVVPEILRSKVRVFVDLHRAQRRAQALARIEAQRAAAEEAKRRSELLAAAGRELGESLDVAQGAERFLRMLVPRFAPLALVSLALDDEPMILCCTGEPPRIERDPGPDRLPPALVRRMQEAGCARLRSELWLGAPAAARYLEVIPLCAAGGAVAVLALGHGGAPAGRSAGDEGMLGELVNLAAIAFENARLYWRLQRESARSKAAEEKLQVAARRKDEFLAMLSHELRNPLAPIRTAAEVMRRTAPAGSSVSWACEVVERQVGHLAQLVEDLLDVSRITQGKISLKIEPIELGRVVQHSLETVRPLLDYRKHEVTVHLPAAPIWVRGDFARLVQVIGNLLNNAAKYTPESGRIELAAAARRGQAEITVRDNGIGIDAALLPHVFELFTQGERSLDRSQGGLGVGLTVVRRLVELHHGCVEVSSDGAGKGATFRVALPCISVVPQSRAEQAAEAAPPGVLGKRVLVVDDNLDAAESIAVFLRLEGHEVRTVPDASQALSVAPVFAPQVAVLDIGLPGMNGYELASRLRERGGLGPEAVLIALTGYGYNEDRARGAQAGFQHFFIKPADPRELAAAIASPARFPEASASPLPSRSGS
jgi:signal transduction histidine kinase/DNA-binding response OmpR family regulator